MNRLKRFLTLLLAFTLVFCGGTTIIAATVNNPAMGDINADGKVNIADCVLVKRSILKTYKLSDEQFARADINHNDSVNIDDYILIKRMILKTYTASEPDPTGEDILLCYIAESWKDISIYKNDFMSAAGYVVNGEVKDYMFSSFIFLCQPNYLYDWDSNGSPYLKPYTKYDWLDYITNYEFAEGKNIDALDSAVGEIKSKLGDTNYKAKVYMTLFYPVETVRYFGNVDGKNLDFSKLEDRYLGIKWMVDESVKQFNAQNYENIELAGFYWFCEEVYEENGEGRAIAKYITDYIRTLDMKTCWCPYFYANGYEDWKEMGFDIATHQANYFPEHRSDWPNKGGPERLSLVARTVKQCGIGVGMEMADSEVASAVIFKEYMKAGIEYDFMNVNHIYYMSTGPKIVSTLSSSNNSTLRSAYDELYKFIHGTLTVNDIK